MNSMFKLASKATRSADWIGGVRLVPCAAFIGHFLLVIGPAKFLAENAQAFTELLQGSADIGSVSLLQLLKGGGVWKSVIFLL